MAIIPVNNLGQYGVIADIASHELPLNAWTFARNVVMRDGFAEKVKGYHPPFTKPDIAPYFLLPVAVPGAYYWIYAGLRKVKVWDEEAHHNLTRVTGLTDVNYAAEADAKWTGGKLGGIPVLANPNDIPQMWFPVETSQRLQALSNWPASTFCHSLRVFKEFLVALYITKPGGVYPQMVKWSHRAPAGSVPASWDETDETKDAGEHELKETDGKCIDCVTLGDLNVIYKDDSTWAQQFIGGISIFRFYNLFQTLGLLSQNCALEIPNRRHAVFGVDDIVVHDGRAASSILNSRQRRRVYNSIDATNFQQAFVAVDFANHEVLFCYPESGVSLPNVALVWNMDSGAIGFRDLPQSAHIASGRVIPTDDDTWDGAIGTWDDQTRIWDQASFRSIARSLLMADTSHTDLQHLNVGTREDGADMTAILQRYGIGYPIKAEGPPDFTTYKLVSRLWPRIDGTVGQTVQIRMGSQDRIDGPVFWGPYRTHTIGTSVPVDVLVSGRLHALEVLSNTALDWRFHGYDVEVKSVGRF